MAAALETDATSRDSGFQLCEVFDPYTNDSSLCTEEALQQLKEWVSKQSRHLSMSKRDREQFAKVTEKYFAELESALSRDKHRSSCEPNESEEAERIEEEGIPQVYQEVCESVSVASTSGTHLQSATDEKVQQHPLNTEDALEFKTYRVGHKTDNKGNGGPQTESVESDETVLRSVQIDDDVVVNIDDDVVVNIDDDVVVNIDDDVVVNIDDDDSENPAVSGSDNSEVRADSNEGHSDCGEASTISTDSNRDEPDVHFADHNTQPNIFSFHLRRSRSEASDSQDGSSPRLNFGTDSEEHNSMLEALSNFLDDQDEYFETLNSEEHCKLLQSLLLHQLKTEREAADPSNAEVIEVALRFFESVRSASLSPQTFKLAYETAVEDDDRLCIETIAHRCLGHFNEVLLYDGFLLSCFMTFMARTVPSSSFDGFRFGFRGTCELCLLDDQLMLTRSCCYKKVCFQCYSHWVTTKVFSRTVEVGCPCCEAFLTAQEIVEMLGDKSSRYTEILTDLNGRPDAKTCPQCNQVTRAPKRKSKKRDGGQIIRCSRCNFSWCFRCHSPLHVGISCKKNSNGVHQLREWSGATYRDGLQLLRKARKCPSCKVLIEKNQGCNHITCNRCHHEFCYVCGKNWRGGNIVFGKHSNRFSIFGCKQNLLPARPKLRKLVRGTLFVLETIGIVIGTPVILGLLLGLSPILGIVGLAVLIYKCKH